MAAETGNAAAIEHFLSMDNLYINAPNRQGQTPIFSAIYGGQVEAVQQLIQAGANINISDNDGFFPAHLVAASNQQGCLEVLVTHGELDISSCRTADGHSLAHTAAYNGYLDFLNHLLSQAPDTDFLNMQTNSGQTVIQSAALGGHYEVFTHIASLNVSLDTTNNEGMTLAHYAAAGGNVGILEDLHNRGHDLWEPDQRGRPPLIYATLGHRRAAASFLVSLVGVAAEQARVAPNICFWRGYFHE